MKLGFELNLHQKASLKDEGLYKPYKEFTRLIKHQYKTFVILKQYNFDKTIQINIVYTCTKMYLLNEIYERKLDTMTTIIVNKKTHKVYI